MNPKVFVSHASEDKKRFVEAFARQLRENGVDAWYDQWEILPGDSLVDKIFEVGIAGAEAIVIVISQYSVDKPWVREELNASVVSRIRKGTKVIPIILDDVEVPVALSSTAWQKVEDVTDFQVPLYRILNSIFGQYDKPPLGPIPQHIGDGSNDIAGLTRIDSRILILLCEYALANRYPWVGVDSAIPDPAVINLSVEELSDSVQVLCDDGYFDTSNELGIPYYRKHLKIQPRTIDLFMKTVKRDSWMELRKAVAALIVNRGILENTQMATELDQTTSFISAVLDVFASDNMIKLGVFLGGRKAVLQVTPALRRWLVQPGT